MFSEIPIWMLWTVLTIVLLIVEIATINLVTIWFVIGSTLAGFLSYYNQPLWLQVSTAIIVSFLCFGIFWYNRSKLSITANTVQPTNADRIIDQTGTVIETIDSLNNSGQIKVLGQIWSAKLKKEGRLPVNSKVKVIALEGVKAVVVGLPDNN